MMDFWRTRFANLRRINIIFYLIGFIVLSAVIWNISEKIKDELSVCKDEYYLPG